MAAQPNIFISYRRDDSAGSAGRIYDRLVNLFGKDRIFKDVDSIAFGQNFKKAMDDSVAGSAVVLAIIGKEYTSLKDSGGVPRIMKETDFVNIELSHALKLGKQVIPVVVDNAKMPGTNDLPKNLQELPFLNAIEIRNENFNGDVDRLASVLDGIVNKEKERIFEGGVRKVQGGRKHKYLPQLFVMVILYIFSFVGLLKYDPRGKEMDLIAGVFFGWLIVLLAYAIIRRGRLSMLEKVILWLVILFDLFMTGLAGLSLMGVSW